MGLESRKPLLHSRALQRQNLSQQGGQQRILSGAPGLVNALLRRHHTNGVDPDYVIVGETNNYNYESILKAVHLVQNGAKLIGTNTDMTGPSESGIIPACRALIAPIELATGKSAYFVGKPNPLMMRTGFAPGSALTRRRCSAIAWLRNS
jgi:NagD protein